MVRITKVYTKTGDKGMTSLAAGKRIAKISPRIAAIGLIDELNAFIGLVLSSLSQVAEFQILQKKLIRIQNELFDFGAQLAVLPEDRRKDTPGIDESDVTRLEKEIDAMNNNLPELKSFILPSGGETSARLHVARTLCRRAEISVLQLIEQEKLNDVLLPYLNRLSDWLFVAARSVAAQLNIPELLWQPRKRDY